MKSIRYISFFIQLVFLSTVTLAQAVQLKAPSEDMFGKDAVVQIFLPAQADVALILEKHFENKNYGAFWKRDDDGSIVIKGFSEFVHELHPLFLQNGFHPSSYFFTPSGQLTEEDEKLVYSESKRTADILITYMVTVTEFSGTVSITHLLSMCELNGEEDLFNSDLETFYVRGSSPEDIFLRVDKKVKKAKRTKSPPVAYYEPILLSEDELVGEIYNLAPDDLDEIVLHLQMTEPVVPDGLKGVMREMAEGAVATSKKRHELRKVMLDSLEFEYMSHPGWDKIENPTHNDYYIATVTSTRKNLHMNFSVGSNGLGASHGSELVSYIYYYLKDAETNDIYIFDYGDFEDAVSSFEGFISALSAEREKQ